MRNLIGNRVTERDVRKWLDANGYFGSSARISDLELHAISRPGWIQVFRFSVTAKRRPGSPPAFSNNTLAEWDTVFGCVRDDERERRPGRQTQIVSFETVEDRDQQLELWSEGLISQSSDNGDDLRPMLIVVGVFVLAALALGMFVS